MAAPDQGFANDDLQGLKSHLLELQLAYNAVPRRRPQRRGKKSLKTNPASLSETKEAIMEKVESDLDAIASSIFMQEEDSNLHLPASKVSTDLYNKLKEIRDSDRSCTQEDIDQVDSLLKHFVCQLDPSYPFVAEPQQDSLKADATDVEDVDQHRQQRMRFENYNVNDMLASLGISDDDDDGDLEMDDDEVRDPDYQEEVRGESEAPTEDAE
ncbi:hypothetical protein H9Q70_000071 [Fusarium xylarioides]|nr:hypothetical protein H9Q70_000071 [Fusarium xylarioides]KAG5785974.1 hypothetical protein H9Q73_000412 [Fusarium xylarioides]